jgi:type I site-specific restriction endonuclease
MAMGWIFGGAVDEKVAQLDRALKDSFARVRQDTTAIYQWLAYFQQQTANQQQLIEAQQHDINDAAEMIANHEQEILRQKQLIERLQAELRSVPKDPEAIKRVIDAYYDFDEIMERVRNTEAKLVRVEQLKAAPAPAVQQIRREAALPHVQAPSRTAALQDKIVQRITRNSKEYLKGLILSMITKYGRISALQLREMIVEEQGLASKSSFYRLIEELEDENAVVVVSDGKEKVLSPAGGAGIKKHAGR